MHQAQRHPCRFRPRDSKKAASTWEAIDDSEVQREMFRKPRDALLALAATFLELTTARLKEIGKLTGDNTKTPDVMDHKSHVVSQYDALQSLRCFFSSEIERHCAFAAEVGSVRSEHDGMRRSTKVSRKRKRESGTKDSRRQLVLSSSDIL